MNLLHSTVVAAFDTRFNGKKTSRLTLDAPVIKLFPDKPGAYLSDANDATASIAPHSSDPVCCLINFHDTTLIDCVRPLPRNSGR